MARFFGKIGYANLVENAPGVWEEQFTERPYFGDVNRFSRALREAKQVNDNVEIGNTISVVADAYAYENFSGIRYVIFEGTKWKVTTIDVERPRLNLTLGGVYNA